MKQRVALLTSADHPELCLGEVLLPPALREMNVDVDICVWDDPSIAWKNYDALVLRCVWDYYKKMPQFMAWLEHIQSQGLTLINDARTLRWNLDKRYLFELAEKGCRLASSILVSREDQRPLSAWLKDFGGREMVLKPVQSASAWRTLRINQHNLDEAQAQFDTWRHEQDFILQAFMPEIVEEGEWSLVYFDGIYSHCLLKRAKQGDFRVQSDHGGTVHTAVLPPGIQEQAAAILRQLDEMPCYARVDGVIRGGQWILMELELLEPELFLEIDPAAPQRFAEAIARRLSVKCS